MPLQKVVIFLEGQGELIFIRKLLVLLNDPAKVSFECFELYGSLEQKVPYAYGMTNPYAEIYFKIINVGNDERVLTAIGEREEKLLKSGVDKIIGLRDMYSKAYRKRSKNVIDDNVTQETLKLVTTIIANMSNPDKINFHFSIIELETWWLSMYNLFARIDDRLTVSFIKEKLGYNLSKIDPEITFFHPSLEIEKIFKLVDTSYKKHFDDDESITSKIKSSDICDATNYHRCDYFKKFCDDLKI